MKLIDRQRQLDVLLLVFRDLWHPQPFRELQPAWCARWPALAAELLTLSDEAALALNDDGALALNFLARHIPEVAELLSLAELPVSPSLGLAHNKLQWAWEIPGRKRQQIEAFVATARKSGQPVLDWCGGKGHLGRLLAHQWQTPVQTLEIDPVLCAAGEGLARRSGVDQTFVVADALNVSSWPKLEQHAVALHACGELHRSLIQRGVADGIGYFDVAPCCYHRGVVAQYQVLSSAPTLTLTRDDTRLAVTESVTAAPRQVRRREQVTAWKLGFDAYRRTLSDGVYRTFKPVPEDWMRAGFVEFMAHMLRREGLPAIDALHAEHFEKTGWQRQREVTRLSVVRHAFRRPLEIWLALDLAMYLEEQGYSAKLGSFCERSLTPRNLLISAERD